jgi:hypothetical protein
MKQFLLKWHWAILFTIFTFTIVFCIVNGYRNVNDIRRDAKDVSNVENFEIVSYEGSSWNLISGGICNYIVKTPKKLGVLYLVEIEKSDESYSVFFKETADQPKKTE